MLYGRAVAARRSARKNIYTAIDRRPDAEAGLGRRSCSAAGLSVPVPDVDRTDHLLILGANPLVSNGSLLTAPDMRGRLRAIRERGGKVVVIDPRRSRTAEEADEHHFIRPGTDALLLFAIVNVLLDEGLAEPGALAEHADGARRGRRARRAVHARGGRAGLRDRRRARSGGMARELAAAERAAVYGADRDDDAGVRHARELAGRRAQRPDRQPRPRGRRDVPAAPRPGSATRPARAGRGKGVRIGRWAQPRERPARGLRRAAGRRRSPRRSRRPARARSARWSRSPATRSSRRPNAGRARGARSTGSTSWSRSTSTSTRPPATPTSSCPRPEPLAKSHYDVALYQLAVRNVANYSPPVLEPTRGSPAEWETMLRARRRSPPARARTRTSRPGRVRRSATLIGREVGDRRARRSRAATPDEIAGRARSAPRARAAARLHAARRPVRRRLRRRPGRADARARSRQARTASTSAPLRPRLPEVLRTPSGKIELAPEAIVADVPRLEAELGARHGNGDMVLDRPPPAALEQLLDAQPAGAGEGQGPLHRRRSIPTTPTGSGSPTAARPGSPRRAGELDRAGRGDRRDHARRRLDPPRLGPRRSPACGSSVAVASTPGVNSNVLAAGEVDEPSGNAVLNGIPVEVVAADREPSAVGA